MRRLEEVLRQMCSAAKAIGNTELENKFAEGENVDAPPSRLRREPAPGGTPEVLLQMLPGPLSDICLEEL